MKTLLALLALTFTSCVVTETTVTAPDGTITYTKISGPAPGAIEAGLVATEIIADK